LTARGIERRTKIYRLGTPVGIRTPFTGGVIALGNQITGGPACLCIFWVFAEDFDSHLVVPAKEGPRKCDILATSNFVKVMFQCRGVVSNTFSVDN